MIRPHRLRLSLLALSCSLVGCLHVPAPCHGNQLVSVVNAGCANVDDANNEHVAADDVMLGGRCGASHGSSVSGPRFGALERVDQVANKYESGVRLAMPQEPKPESQPTAAHAAGSDVLTVSAFYGVPILQKSFFWDGNGEVDDSGLGVHWLHYVADGVALGPGLNAATWWTPGSDVYSAEVQALLRIHPLDSLPVFLDGSAGYQLANDQIPPGGTVWNFTFGFGFGAEYPVADKTRLQAGAMYHHISNALGRQNDRNPSQNEVRFWVGLAFDL